MSTTWEEKRVSLGGAIIGGAITLIVGVFIGLNWHNFAGYILPYFGNNSSYASHDWSSLDEVYAALSANYDGEIDQATLIEGAKKGLVESIGDIYTVYMDQAEASAYEDSLHGKVGAGIGVEIALRDNYVRVIRTLPDNPAGKAGVKAGDIIYKVNGEEVYAESTDVISSKLRGELGTEVKLTIVRDGEEKDFTLKRETINNVSAYVNYDGNTAIITISRFDSDTGTIVRDIVNKDFKNKNIKKVILDLRNNGGGYVDAAVELLSLWLDNENAFIERGKNGQDKNHPTLRGQALLKDIPTVVLVNGTTASASEIVAGALQDYDKATLLGEKTYGKGVMQTLLNLQTGMLKVTTAHWYTPNGNSINGDGITPDVEVKLTYEDTNMSRDPQLDAAKKLKN